MNIRDGVLNINKPQGITSFDVVAKVKKVTRVKKVGHAGTLDPEASGVLLICLGKATRIVPFLMDATKEYRATLHLGITTDTLDSTGKIVQRTEKITTTEEEIREAVSSFTGEIEQIPPMFSALWHQGRRLYELAREGVEVERKPRKIIIHRLTILSYDPPYLTFEVTCSKGTYIRSLCADIGQKLGVGGHMSWLQRLKVGDMSIEQAIPFEVLDQKGAAEILAAKITPADKVLKFLPAVQIRSWAKRAALHGVPLSDRQVILDHPEQLRKGDLVRGYDSEGRFIGIFEALVDLSGLRQQQPQAEPLQDGCLQAEPPQTSQEELWFKPKRLL